MKTKRTVIAVLAAVLLISAALIVGCISQFDGLSEKDTTEDNTPIPVGKGRVKLTITKGEKNARTILPSTSMAELYVEVIFTDTSDSTHVIRYPTTANTAQLYGSGVSPVIEDGEYDVAINVYSSATATTANLVSGWGTTADDYDGPYTVASLGTTDSIVAELVGVITPGGTKNGFFTYSIAVPALPVGSNTPGIAYISNASDATSMLLDVTPYSGGGSITGFPIVIDTTGITATPPNTKVTLPSGYYNVTVTLKAVSCQPRILRNIMHVYDNLTTPYAPTISSLVQDEFTVKFDTTTNLTTASAISSQPINNAATATRPPTDPTDSNNAYDFVNWYTTADGSTLFNFAGLIFRDVTAFAKWTLKSGNDNVPITISIAQPSEGAQLAAVKSKDPISYNDLKGDATITLTLTGLPATGANWYLSSDTTPFVTGVSTFTIDKDTTWLNKLASGDIVIQVIGVGASVPYSGTVTITITN